MKHYGKIVLDKDPINPRVEYEHLTTMFIIHPKYKHLGDKHDYVPGDFDGWNNCAERLKAAHKIVRMHPLFIYDHGGVCLSTKGDGVFSDPWDSCMVGFIAITQDRVNMHFSKDGSDVGLSEEELESIIQYDITEYNQYLAGDVYGYIIEDEFGNELDSCWGYYGRDNAEQALQEELQSFLPSTAKLLLEIDRSAFEEQFGKISNEQWSSILERLEDIRDSLVEKCIMELQPTVALSKTDESIEIN